MNISQGRICYSTVTNNPPNLLAAETKRFNPHSHDVHTGLLRTLSSKDVNASPWLVLQRPHASPNTDTSLLVHPLLILNQRIRDSGAIYVRDAGIW